MRIEIDTKELDWAWAAGFFDGEGSISLKRTWTKATNRKTYTPYLHLAQVDRAVLDHFHRIVGCGTIAPNSRTYHERPSGNRAPSWQWCCSASSAEATATAMLPYLVLKRERALLLLEYRKICNRRRSSYHRLTDEEMALRQAMADQMRYLNMNTVQRRASETKSKGTPALKAV